MKTKKIIIKYTFKCKTCPYIFTSTKKDVYDDLEGHSILKHNEIEEI